ncbi:MAG: GNAT family N-acetyltransferase, partial [Candidatus Omnitrophota bacterium]
MNVQIARANIADAEEILGLQKLAYLSEAELYNNYGIQPLTETIDEIKSCFETHIILKAVAGSKIVGTVRAFAKDGTCHVGRLAVHPEMQNQGAGTALMKEIERYFKPARFELFVGTKSGKNIHVYQ